MGDGETLTCACACKTFGEIKEKSDCVTLIGSMPDVD